MRILVYIVVLALVLFFLFIWFQKIIIALDNNVEINNEMPSYVPESSDGRILLRDNFALSYNTETRQADWAAYMLSRDMLNSKKIEGRKDFARDRETGMNAPGPRDYSHSGYTRGHLVPSADMSFSESSKEQSYLMSNISPQIREFNGGIWRELEEHTRDWARKYKKVYVVTGPIFGKLPDSIGDSGVRVPESFYKVVMDIDDPELKGIGFIIPNDKSEIPLQNFAVSIDSVEALTGIDFFSNVVNNERLEKRLESEINTRLWTFKEKWYQLRINQWNN
jgi:endonuclease G